MKKLLGIVVLGLFFNNNLLAEEYSNSWKMDIFCKQGKWEWYESAFVVNVENNEFSLGPFNRWQNKNIKFKGKIAGNKIKISESVTFKNGNKDNINYSGEFINDKEAILKGRTSWDPPWKCNGKFFKLRSCKIFGPISKASCAPSTVIFFITFCFASL